MIYYENEVYVLNFKSEDWYNEFYKLIVSSKNKETIEKIKDEIERYEKDNFLEEKVFLQDYFFNLESFNKFLPNLVKKFQTLKPYDVTNITQDLRLQMTKFIVSNLVLGIEVKDFLFNYEFIKEKELEKEYAFLIKENYSEKIVKELDDFMRKMYIYIKNHPAIKYLSQEALEIGFYLYGKTSWKISTVNFIE